MALRSGLVTLPWDLTPAPPPGNDDSDPPGLGNSSHSLRYFYTGVSEPDQRMPQFILVGFVDDQLFVQYDSNTKRTRPQAAWIKKVEEEDPKYFDRNTDIFQNVQRVFRKNLKILGKHYNQSGGFHSLQWMYGCELRKDGSKGGHWQVAYDGKDYISFDMETLTWVAADPMAQITKREWEAIPGYAQRCKAYLEETCMEWLRKYLEYGAEALLRAVPPVGKVTRTYRPGGRERLVCQAYGFYPKEIETNWKKDGKVVEEVTGRRNIAPNSNRTFHDWISIKIDPEDRHLYRCHIDHDGLEAPLVLAREEPGANEGSTVKMSGPVTTFLVVFFVVFLILWQQKKSAYNAAPRKWRKKSAYNAAPSE